MKLCLAFAPLFLLSLATGGCTALAPMMAQPGTAGAQPGSSSPNASPSNASPSAPSMSSTESSSSSSPSASTPSVVSVNIRNTCGKTVKVFFGEKPKFGSGTYSTASSNSVSSHSFKAGELFWIVDESENGLASVTVKEQTREIEILGSCHELAAR